MPAMMRQLALLLVFLSAKEHARPIFSLTFDRSLIKDHTEAADAMAAVLLNSILVPLLIVVLTWLVVRLNARVSGLDYSSQSLNPSVEGRA